MPQVPGRPAGNRVLLERAPRGRVPRSADSLAHVGDLEKLRPLFGQPFPVVAGVLGQHHRDRLGRVQVDDERVADKRSELIEGTTEPDSRLGQVAPGITCVPRFLVSILDGGGGHGGRREAAPLSYLPIAEVRVALSQVDRVCPALGEPEGPAVLVKFERAATNNVRKRLDLCGDSEPLRNFESRITIDAAELTGAIRRDHYSRP